MDIIGHHVCKKDGGIEFVEKEGPFISEHKPDENEPFLGTGFYYWDDDRDTAKWWGNLPNGAYKGCFYIIESRLIVKTNIFFDLVGNKQHMKLFVQMAIKYRQR